MHWTLLITFDKDRAQNSEEAREFALTQLAVDRSLVDWYGDGALADWIEIGGRASGMLTRAKQPQLTETPLPLPFRPSGGYSPGIGRGAARLHHPRQRGRRDGG